MADLARSDNREVHADAAIAGLRLKIGLEVVRQPKRDIAVACAHTPTRGDPRTFQHSGFDRSVVGLESESIESTLDLNMAIAGSRLQPAIQTCSINVAVTGGK